MRWRGTSKMRKAVSNPRDVLDLCSTRPHRGRLRPRSPLFFLLAAVLSLQEMFLYSLDFQGIMPVAKRRLS